MSIYSRKYEINLILECVNSRKAELGVIYGRRRVGKSYLLKYLTQKETGRDLYFEAIKGLPKSKQIDHFLDQFSQQTNGPRYKAKDWKEAFQVITPFITKGTHLIVFDEFPWMASEKSELVSILKFFWDQYWKNNSKITMILCGSIAQFMVKHILHSEALHNRRTFELKLEPLKAYEAKEFFKNQCTDREIMEYLMLFGGIPKYLELINPRESQAANINKLCLKKGGFFLSEFETVFKEQFKSIKNYQKIIEALSLNSKSKEQLSREIEISSGGGFGKYLEHLSDADFVKEFESVTVVRDSKTRRYKIWDEWMRSYFYLFKKHQETLEKNTKNHLFSSLIENRLPLFFGLTFEIFCMKNIENILEWLKIPVEEVVCIGPYFTQGPRGRSRTKALKENRGVQIDILIVRKKNRLTIIECKYTKNPVGIEVIKEIDEKINKLALRKKFSFEKVLISAAGVTDSLKEEEYFDKILGVEALLVKA